MQLKQKTRYAIRILLYLAQDREYVNIDMLAQQVAVPLAYLHRIVIDLRNAELVESIGGSKGDFRLRQAPPLISLYDVLAAVDDLFQSAASPPELAGREKMYERETDVLLAMQSELQTVLRGITLDSFCGIKTAKSRAPTHPASGVELPSAASPKRQEFG